MNLSGADHAAMHTRRSLHPAKTILYYTTLRMIRSVRAVQTHSKAADNLNFSNVLIERNEPVITKSDIKVQTKKCFTPFIYLDPDILVASLRSETLLL